MRAVFVLGIGITFAVLRPIGKRPCFSESLYREANTWEISLIQSLYAQFGMVLLSAYLFSSLLIMSFTCCSVIIVNENNNNNNNNNKNNNNNNNYIEEYRMEDYGRKIILCVFGSWL